LDKAAYKTVAGRILSSSNIKNHNSFEQPEKIKPQPYKGAALKGSTLTVTLPAASVVVLELK
jgi:alpha-L-arabinofuranosidase